jgi:hypothetical protein
MLTRTISRTVVFRHEFTLRDLGETRPAGSYIVDTEEELIESLSFPAYRRVSTWMRFPVGGGIDEVAKVDPLDLEAALAADEAAPPFDPEIPARPADAAEPEVPRQLIGRPRGRLARLWAGKTG